MELVGKIKTALPLQEGMGQRGPWCRATVIVEYISGRYANMVALECGNNKAREFAKLPAGRDIKFQFEPVSREFNGKYYTSCNCFAWEVVGGYAAPPQTDDLP